MPLTHSVTHPPPYSLTSPSHTPPSGHGVLAAEETAEGRQRCDFSHQTHVIFPEWAGNRGSWGRQLLQHSIVWWVRKNRVCSCSCVCVCGRGWREQIRGRQERGQLQGLFRVRACQAWTPVTATNWTPGELLFPARWSRLQWLSSPHRPPRKLQTQMFRQTGWNSCLCNVDRNSLKTTGEALWHQTLSPVVNYTGKYLWINTSISFNLSRGLVDQIAEHHLKSSKKNLELNLYLCKKGTFHLSFCVRNHYVPCWGEEMC